MQLRAFLDTVMPDMTQVERYRTFAHAMGVSVFTVYKWLDKTRRIRDPQKLKIVQLTRGQVTLDDLVRE